MFDFAVLIDSSLTPPKTSVERDFALLQLPESATFYKVIYIGQGEEKAASSVKRGRRSRSSSGEDRASPKRQKQSKAQSKDASVKKEEEEEEDESEEEEESGNLAGFDEAE